MKVEVCPERCLHMTAIECDFREVIVYIVIYTRIQSRARLFLWCAKMVSLALRVAAFVLGYDHRNFE